MKKKLNNLFIMSLASKDFNSLTLTKRKSSGKALHEDLLLEDIGHLYHNEDFSDIVLSVGEECIPAHRMILASRSEYFRALLYGGLKETNEKEIRLSNDTPQDAFRCILKYIYSGTMDFSAHSVLKQQRLLYLSQLKLFDLSRYLHRI